MSLNRRVSVLTFLAVVLSLALFAARPQTPPPLTLEKVLELPPVGIAGVELAVLYDNVLYYSDSGPFRGSIGHDQSTLEALDIGTGQRMWSHTGIGETFLMTRGDSGLWVEDTKAALQLVSIENGQVAAEFDLPEGFYEFVSTEDRLFGSATDLVYALDASTGVSLWSSSIPIGFHPANRWEVYRWTFKIPWDYSGLEYDGQHILVTLIGTRGSSSHRHPAMILALDAADGTESWRFSYDLPMTLEGGIARWPVLIDSGQGIVILAADTLHALEASTGEMMWSMGDDLGYFSSRPIVVGGGMVVTCCQTGDQIVSIDLEEGNVAWTHKQLSRIELLQPVEDKGILVHYDSGTFEYIELRSGQSLWTWSPKNDQECWGGDIIASEIKDNRLYIATTTKVCVYRFDGR